MAENPSVKKYYDYAQQQVDEQAIADKFNAATAAQFNVQREQNRQAENQFYNQMYNTQRTAMDTIRQSNAAAVSNGASRGVQAANELSALLGLQEQSVASATELAQANRQTAQEETAAVLENMLNAYQQAVAERQQLVQQGIESASVDAQQEANVTQQQATDIERAANVVSSAENSFAGALAAATAGGYDPSTEYNTTNQSNLENTLYAIDNEVKDFKDSDWDKSSTGKDKANKIVNYATQLCITYGLDPNDPEISKAMNTLTNTASQHAHMFGGLDPNKRTKANQARTTNAKVTDLFDTIRLAYANKINAPKE